MGAWHAPHVGSKRAWDGSQYVTVALAHMADGRSDHAGACRPSACTINLVTPGAGDKDGGPRAGWSTVSDHAEVGGRPTGGRAYTAAGSVTAEVSAVAGFGGNEGAGEGCWGGVGTADTTTPVFSSVQGGSLEMPGASTSKGSVAPALGVPAGEALFDARGVILLTHAPPDVSAFEALLEALL